MDGFERSIWTPNNDWSWILLTTITTSSSSCFYKKAPYYNIPGLSSSFPRPMVTWYQSNSDLLLIALGDQGCHVEYQAVILIVYNPCLDDNSRLLVRLTFQRGWSAIWVVHRLSAPSRVKSTKKGKFLSTCLTLVVTIETEFSSAGVDINRRLLSFMTMDRLWCLFGGCSVSR